MTTFGPLNTVAPYLPNSQTFSEDDDQFLIQITNRDRDIARHINIREIASYDMVDLPTGQQWFTAGNPQIKRGGFRKVIPFGAYSPGTNNTIAHGIIGIVTFTLIIGTALTTTDIGTGLITLPLPYVNVTNVTAGIDLKADPVNIYLDVGAASFTLTSGLVILEYLKN